MRNLLGRTATVAAAALFAACGGGGGTGNEDATSLAIAANGATSFTGNAGLALAGDRPSVKVTDLETGAPRGGVSVTFTVTGGSGTLSGATRTTDAEGIATVGGWTLGTAAGANGVRASVTDGSLVRTQDFTATGTPGAAARAVFASSPAATVSAGATLGNVQVDLADQFGNVTGTGTNEITISLGANPGGSTLGGTTSTAAVNGRATFANLTLNKVGANYRLSATGTGLQAASSQFFAITPASAAALAKSAGDGQDAIANDAVAVLPSVQVTDAFGNPVTGASVTFAVASGGGRVGGAVRQTNASGIATVGGWSLGSTGANTMTASVAGVAPVTFSATAGALTGSYDIDVRYVGPTPDAAIQSAFQNAANRWSRVLRELPNVTFGANGIPADGCIDGQPAINNQTIDDIIIYASIDSIDGPNKTLGQAGPCYTRPNTLLIIVGAMVFDSADVRSMVNNGTLSDVIVHEMGHVIGIGATWGQQLSRTATSGSDTTWIRSTDVRYTGMWGNVDYFAFGAAASGPGAPIENCGAGSPNGCGTGNWLGHWRETAFNNELMTGFIEASNNLLSRMSIGALQDLGYPVNMAGADSYNLPTMALFSGPTPRKRPINDAPLGTPLREIHPDGRITVAR